MRKKSSQLLAPGLFGLPWRFKNAAGWRHNCFGLANLSTGFSVNPLITAMEPSALRSATVATVYQQDAMNLWG